MKKILFILSTLFILSCSSPKEETYCGKIVDMWRTGNGYRTSNSNHVIFYCEKLKRNIDVTNVSDNCYANLTKGQYVCFKLYDFQLER